jgi:predicted O-methyltransferase YrrM
LSAEEAERATEPVEGFVSASEGRLLYKLAVSATGRIVEVGSWKGRSTIWLAFGSQDGNQAKVYAIDPHTGSSDHAEKGESSTREAFHQNVRAAGVEDTVVPMVMCSKDARDQVPCPIGLLFLDGPNDEALIRKEIDRWLPCLGEGAMIAVHDTVASAGAREASEHLYLSSRFVDARLVGSITYATVVKEAPVRGKLMDLSRLLARRAEVIFGRFNYPAPVRKIARKVLSTLSL